MTAVARDQPKLVVEARRLVDELGWHPQEAAQSLGVARGALYRMLAGELTDDDPGPHEPEQRVGGRLLELDEFLARDIPDHDWLVPGLLERSDRLIITGPEGGGKSTLLRQLGVQAASGVHPFGGDAFGPLRVLLLDLENGIRQVHRKLRPLRLAAGTAYSGTLLLHVRPQGLDLLDGDDAAWLRATAADARPDIVLTGPLYRLAGGDPTSEEVAKTVSRHLDHLRAQHGCAIVLEAHTPYGSNGARRPERPYGASLWSRWPEFGIFLDPDSGHLRHWRGPRDERDWPALLDRGGAWPWSPAARPAREAVWSKIVAECIRVGGRPSLRELADRLGESYSAIQRATKDHSGEWEAMA